VRRARVVAIFHQLDQRKADEILIELDGLLDVAADQRQMVQAARGGRRPVRRWTQVLLRPALAAGVELDTAFVFGGGGHR